MQLDFHNKPRLRSAYGLAVKAHDGQKRKYTGEDHIEHPVAVAEILLRHGLIDENVLCAAVLHDTLEDTELPADVINSEVGGTVLRWVRLLTDTEQGNRATRKALALKRLAAAPPQVQAIKLADMIDNTKSIVEHDPGFAELYLQEKRALVLALTEGKRVYPELWKEAMDTCAAGMNQLAVHHLMNGMAAQKAVEDDDKEIAALLALDEMDILAGAALF